LLRNAKKRLRRERGAAPEVVRTRAELRARVDRWRRQGAAVGLVPTMGALHDGHTALVAAAEAANDRVVATIFVNPTQFGAGEDFESYPRDEVDDLRRLAAAGTDLVYIPGIGEIYPRGFATTVAVGGVTEGLEGVYRPGHFDGVATVVAKLLLQARADRAYFGEKDYQQLLVVRKLARDLDIAVEIVGVPTVRAADGLALSSRNAYLSEEQRAIAPALHRALTAVARKVAGDPEGVAAAVAGGREAVLGAGFEAVDYIAVCDAETLAPLAAVDRPARVLGAARLGRARLIDNVAVE
jgi:pantoate--beta-alanine ligase